MKTRALAFLALVSFIAFGYSQLGGACDFTADCVSGYCSNDTGTCISPALSRYAVGEACNLSRECIEGYCSANKCVIPILEAATFLSFGPKSGCAGLVEESSLGSSVFICHALWILLFIASGLAGFIAREDKNRLVPLGAVLLPLFIGVFIYVFAGILIAIVEIALLYYRTERGREYVELPAELEPA